MATIALANASMGDYKLKSSEDYEVGRAVTRGAVPAAASRAPLTDLRDATAEGLKLETNSCLGEAAEMSLLWPSSSLKDSYKYRRCVMDTRRNRREEKTQPIR